MPYKTVTLGPAYAVRLEDLLVTDYLLTRCLNCGKEWHVAPHQMYLKYPGFTKIKDMMFFFNCRNCGSEAYGWEVKRAVTKDPRSAM